MLRIAINGFGRIGKTFLRTLLLDKKAATSIEVVAINTGSPAHEYLAHLFKYDSVYRELNCNIRQEDETLCIDNLRIPLLAEKDPALLPWKRLGVDWVIECSGRFTTKAAATAHLQAGASNVLISAPADDADLTVIPGINQHSFAPQKHKIVSLGSCTTNCFAPLIKVLHEHFTLESGMMSTIHAYTNDQSLVDAEHKDPRRARAAGQNIIPTKTGAEKAIIKIYPELVGKLKAQALRVPVIDASLVDFVFTTKETTTPETINALFEKAAQNELKGTIAFSTLPLVSSDIIAKPYGALIDGLLTQSLGTTSRICAWYDNEFGYASQMKEFLLHL